MAKFLPSILTSISKKPPSATSNIKLIFVPCFSLSKKHFSVRASTATKYARDFCVNTRRQRHNIKKEEEFAEDPIFVANKRAGRSDFERRFVK